MNNLYAGALALAVAAMVSPASADPVHDAAEAAFAKAVQEYRVPGLAVGVTRGGQHSFYTTGLASQKEGIAVTPDTLFELGSISKLFNVTLAALAEQRGTLSLEDGVSAHLPPLKSTPAGELTLMDLATHRTGGMPLQVPDEARDTSALIDWLKNWSPQQANARSYSNISTGLLGHIAADSLGDDYAEAAQRLFADMGLRDTWIAVPDARMSDYAFGYHRETDAPIRVNPGVLDAEAYGVKSSVRDMLTFLDMQLDPASATPQLQRAIVRTQQMQHQTAAFCQSMIWEAYPLPFDVTRMVAGNSADYALKPQPMQAAQDCTLPVIFNKTGATNGFSGYVVIVPQQDLGVVVLANRNFPNEARVRATMALIDALGG